LPLGAHAGNFATGTSRIISISKGSNLASHSCGDDIPNFQT
jgi:hypothetical protein